MNDVQLPFLPKQGNDIADAAKAVTGAAKSVQATSEKIGAAADAVLSYHTPCFFGAGVALGLVVAALWLLRKA